jgi:hypothetical protein
MCTQATEYDGEWSWSKMHGQGCFKFSNGDVYRGTFKDNQRHGQGTCRAVNGDVYQGEWRFGLQHGRGRWETKDGMIYDGEWKVNKLIVLLLIVVRTNANTRRKIEHMAQVSLLSRMAKNGTAFFMRCLLLTFFACWHSTGPKEREKRREGGP